MNKKQAEEKGYRYTGIYARDREEIKKRAEIIRKEGYKAITVTVPDSKYSRGGVGVGYSVYVEEKYVINERKKEAIQKAEREKNNMIEERKRIVLRLAEIDSILQKSNEGEIK